MTGGMSQEINAPGRSSLNETVQNWGSPHGKDAELTEEVQRRPRRHYKAEEVGVLLENGRFLIGVILLGLPVFEGTIFF